MDFVVFNKQIGIWNVRIWMPTTACLEKRPCILLHGFMQDADSWDNVAQSLVSDGRVVVVPNMMPVSKEHAALIDYARGVREIFLWLHMRMPELLRPHLVGYSMGGRIVLTLLDRLQRKQEKDMDATDVAPANTTAAAAADTANAASMNAAGVKSAPENSLISRYIATITFESAGLGPQNEADRSSYADRNRTFAARIANAETMSDVVDFWEALPIFQTQRALPQKMREEIHQARLSLAPYQQQLSWAVDSAGAQHMKTAAENRALLASVGVPVCYIAGKSDQKYMSVAQSIAETHAAKIRVSYIAGGHDVHLENPDDYVACLRTFLNAYDMPAEQEERE